MPEVEGVSLSIGGSTFSPENPVSALHLFQYDNVLTPEASPAPEHLLRLPEQKAGDSASAIPHESSETGAQPPAALLARRPQGYFEINIRYSPGTEDAENRAGEIAEMSLICKCLGKFSAFGAGGKF